MSWKEIVVVDFEFETPPGDPVVPICMVANELVSGREFRLFQDELQRAPKPPFATGKDVLIIAYSAQAELSCYLALGWEMPETIVDLFFEYRAHTNGLRPTAVDKKLRKLSDALDYFKLDGLLAVGKREMQEALGGGAWKEKYSKEEILDYCASDVVATIKLWEAMQPLITKTPQSTAQALWRGQYAVAVADIQHRGIPIDMGMRDQFLETWDIIKEDLIKETDADYGVFEGIHFRQKLYDDWIQRNSYDRWPTTPTGQYSRDKEALEEMAELYPEVNGLRELLVTLSSMHLHKITVGSDGRNRAHLFPFNTVTGRNSPSSAEFLFGAARWLRGLLKPPPGYGLAYVDWAQQEVAIAAALSGDGNLLQAYGSGDIYMAFAIQCGLAPPGATDKTHPHERDVCKTVILATQYGQGAVSLARRLKVSEREARDLLRKHRTTYSKFWSWSDDNLSKAMRDRSLCTVFGWPRHVVRGENPRSLQNYRMQANGSEMMRLAAWFAVKRGIEVVAPVHDAFAIIAPLEEIDHRTEQMQQIMVEASRKVLSGFEVGTEAKIVRYPDRYLDKRGEAMWGRVVKLSTAAKLRRAA
jgi:DNA polymerase I-like protein with 3'-5' exonuclease and polymerase domains